MIGLAVLGLLFVFFIVLAVFAAKTWQTGHVVGLVFLFLNILLLAYLTAVVLKVHDQYRKPYQTAKADLANELKKQEDVKKQLAALQTLARAETLERGRVWRNVRLGQGPNNVISLNMRFWKKDGCLQVGKEELDESNVPAPIPDENASGGDETANPANPTPDPATNVAENGAVDGTAPPADGAAGAATDPSGAAAAPADGTAVAAEPVGPPPSAHGIVKDQVVYGFKEFPIAKFLTPAEKEQYFADLSPEGEGTNFADQDTKNACRVPLAYLGRFRVVEVTDEVIRILPEDSIDAAQQKMIGDSATWALYEQLPLDSHDLYAGLDKNKLAELIPLQRMNQLGIPLSTQSYGAFLAELDADGKPADERQMPPDRLTLEVEFTQAHEIVVDLDVEGDLPPATTPFTSDGRAQVKNLMQNSVTKFEVGQKARFDFLTGQDLVNRGIAKRVPEGAVQFRRSLRDFEFSLKDFGARGTGLVEELRSRQVDLTALQSAGNRLQEQIAKFEGEQGKLEQDLNGFQGEQQQLQAYMRELQAREARLKQRINTLYGAQRIRTAPLASR